MFFMLEGTLFTGSRCSISIPLYLEKSRFQGEFLAVSY